MSEGVRIFGFFDRHSQQNENQLLVDLRDRKYVTSIRIFEVQNIGLQVELNPFP